MATSWVFTKEWEVFRAQHLDLIYSQLGILYEIIPNTPRSNFDLSKLKLEPHFYGIVSSSQSKATYMISN